jgi:hypothetical protein
MMLLLHFFADTVECEMKTRSISHRNFNVWRGEAKNRRCNFVVVVAQREKRLLFISHLMQSQIVMAGFALRDICHSLIPFTSLSLYR